MFADEVLLGEFELQSDRTIEERWPLPSEVSDREFVAIRFESSDYVYVGPTLEHCVSFQLESLAVE